MSTAGEAINTAIDAILEWRDDACPDLGEAIANHPKFRHWLAGHDARRREGERAVWLEATEGISPVSPVATYMNGSRWQG